MNALNKTSAHDSEEEEEELLLKEGTLTARWIWQGCVNLDVRHGEKGLWAPLTDPYLISG